MNTQEQITNYIDSLPAAKRADVQALHQHIRRWLPHGKLWFLDGTDGQGKVVANPQIGYGLWTIKYANGKTKDFYQVGISANTAGISVYIMGIKDKKYLPKTYGTTIGKANVTGYCIKFKTLADISLNVLQAATQDALRQTS